MPHDCYYIRDHRIYNLALRHGKSNPHHGAGYLIHPQFINVLARWLTAWRGLYLFAVVLRQA